MAAPEKNKMENPYEKFGAHPCEVRAGRPLLWLFLVLFCLGISLPPLIRNFRDAGKPALERWVPAVEFWNHPNAKAKATLDKKREGTARITRTEPSLRDHLLAVEGEIKNGDFRKSIAQNDQKILTSVFNEGNAKAVIGRDGWYFLQAGIDGLISYGPLKPEPDAVTKDPDRADWFPPLNVIEKFGKQLEERGIELMLVPVPVKPMIYPEHLAAGAEAPARHRDQLALYEKIREAGIDVVDLTDDMMKWKAESDEPIFLKQDTHWTHDTMERAAKAVAERVKAKPYFDSLEKNLNTETEIVTRDWIGDLVNTLTDNQPGELYQPETQEIVRVLDSATGEPVADDLNSPIALLGDSFVNVFDVPEIGFGAEDESAIGAGFADTLAKELGLKLDTHTANGGGATAVRKSFARSGDDRISKKKLVIWTIASRDLLLSETPGGKADVRWSDVSFGKQETEAESSSGESKESSNEELPSVPANYRKSNPDATLVIAGTLKERSALADPKSTPYADSIFSALFDQLEVIEGEYIDDEAYVFLWGFKDREFLPTANLQPGARLLLELKPLSDATEVNKLNRADTLDAFYDQFFAVKAIDLNAEQPSESGKAASNGNIASPLQLPAGFLIFVFGVAAYVLIGVIVQLKQRKAISTNQ